MIRSEGVRRQAWILYLSAAVLVAVLYFVIPTTPISKLVLHNGIGLSAIVAILIGILVHRPARARSWCLIAGGAASFLSGDICYYVLGLRIAGSTRWARGCSYDVRRVDRGA